VTQPDRPKGRGRKISESPVKQLGITNKIPIYQPEKVSEKRFCEFIRSVAPDLMVVVAFGQVLNKEMLSIPRFGAINIHASLLPKYRGAAPIQRAILNNETVTGLTVMHMDEGLDTGPILYQREVPIEKDETAGHLHDRLSNIAGELTIEFMEHIKGNRVEEKPQDNAEATYAGKIDKSMCSINWEMDAEKISAHIRALDPMPGAITILDGNNIKLFSSRVVDAKNRGESPGRVVAEEGGYLGIETGKGLVGIGELQAPGKKRLPAKVFLRGIPIPVGTVLGQ
jgi:methionyl-tRNA formyltransferase